MKKKFLLIRVVQKWNGKTVNCRIVSDISFHFSLKLYTKVFEQWEDRIAGLEK